MYFLAINIYFWYYIRYEYYGNTGFPERNGIDELSRRYMEQSAGDT